MTALDFSDIQAARQMLKEVTINHPLQSSRTFSEMAGCQVFLKPECLQKNGSHKLRGAYYMLSKLQPQQRAKGVVTFSAGNWAQGAAYAGSLLNIPVTVIMPEAANPKKAAATRGYGGEVILFGRDSTQLFNRAQSLAAEKGALLVNPLDNPDLMIGLASLGLEMLEGEPGLEALVVPVGGGGLIAGIASAVKHLAPAVKVYGVQPHGASAMVRSLEAGRAVEIDQVQTIADGLAVKKPSQKTVDVIKETVDQVVLVSDEEIKEAIFLLLERAKLVVEPAGAASLAAVLNRRLPDLAGKKTAVLLTGGNVDFQLLAQIVTSHA
ncbi:MAG: pyridoxal-phosphate dependent enzyme [Deltaproteobacteria bacterium]|nr:pyridoxal-phosphate dependent enzyme [Deltaproteobacteria bacterium]